MPNAPPPQKYPATAAKSFSRKVLVLAYPVCPPFSKDRLRCGSDTTVLKHPNQPYFRPF
ncbi:hypothetical protein HMPREF0742_01136 [Rothia aeria F0184]|uniref:Uncharacterized protein n=1 Tax=Rothia aeria F0184 TaxID=888019 RepID=U7V4M4_9MICC|nr:hypothetical protein HMPREF0742_01136 [Rothia aeria F0184]